MSGGHNANCRRKCQSARGSGNPSRDSTLKIEHAGALRAVVRILGSVDRLRLTAVPPGIGVVKVRHHVQAVFLKRKGAIGVEQIRLIPIDQIVHSQEIMAPPGVGYAVRIPGELLINLLHVVIQIRILRVRPVVGNAGVRPGLIRAVAYREPLVADPKVLAYGELQPLLQRRLSE